MDVDLLAVVALALLAVAHLEPARLVVGAVRARDELAVRLRPREPRFEVVLLRRRVVERAAHNVDDAVRDAERLVELCGGGGGGGSSPAAKAAAKKKSAKAKLSFKKRALSKAAAAGEDTTKLAAEIAELEAFIAK